MPPQYLNYPGQARRIADAGAILLEALEEPAMDKSIAIVELEAATSSPVDLRARFEPASTTSMPAARSPEDILSGILLELQSANALMAAGLAINEQGAEAEPKFLGEVVAQVESTASALEAHIAKSAQMQFAPQVEPSATTEQARKLCQESGSRALDSIADGTENIVRSVVAKLKQLDQATVIRAIENLGSSFEVSGKRGKLPSSNVFSIS